MTLEHFRADPWKNAHSAYDESVFAMRPAPEFATAEVLVASMHRAIGFADVSERGVPASGKDFDKLTQRVRLPQGLSPTVERETWRTVLHGILESPKQPNQSSRRFLQLSPVVPDVARYSGSARLTGSSWNPGVLIQRLIGIGSRSGVEAEERWSALFNALSVTPNDDVWARWLQGEFETWNKAGSTWAQQPMTEKVELALADWESLRFPAKQFVRDLDAVLRAKSSMTRRQWISLLEAIVRLGTVTHTLWLCDVNDVLWRAIRGALSGDTYVQGYLESELARRPAYMSYGNPAVPDVRDFAGRYLNARLGINLVLWRLQEIGITVAKLGSLAGVMVALAQVSGCADRLGSAAILGDLAELQGEQSRTIACKKGIGSNLVEFARHTLGQRQTANDSLRGYDQGYLLKKKGEYAAAPWIVSLGPVAILALVHCCLDEVNGPRSVHRLAEHLQCYGIRVDQDDLASSDLGRHLRMLGLVLDSPDAESGMLLVPPFQVLGEPAV
jgi:hypothetical protein